MIKVLLADDHQMFLDGLKYVLSQEAEIEVVGEANNGDQVMQILEEKKVDVVVSDIDMSKMNGIEATKLIKQKYPAIKVVICSMHNRKQYILQLMEIGANGYVLKEKSERELVSAIHNVYRGNSHFSLEVLNQITSEVTNKSSNEDLSSKLSQREREVIILIAEGLSSKEIADRLHIVKATVDTHRRNLLQKLNVPNDKHLVRYAIRHGLIEA